MKKATFCFSVFALVLSFTLSAAPAFAAANLSPPTGPSDNAVVAPIKDKFTEYSVRTSVNACLDPETEKCSIDTFVVAKAASNGELIWERRIYFQHYDSKKELDPQLIPVKTLKFQGRKIVAIKNSRGDFFEIDTAHGHLKKPKEVKEYKK